MPIGNIPTIVLEWKCMHESSFSESILLCIRIDSEKTQVVFAKVGDHKLCHFSRLLSSFPARKMCGAAKVKRMLFTCAAASTSKAPYSLLNSRAYNCCVSCICFLCAKWIQRKQKKKKIARSGSCRIIHFAECECVAPTRRQRAWRDGRMEREQCAPIKNANRIHLRAK